jgi:hypothetical protein
MTNKRPEPYKDLSLEDIKGEEWRDVKDFEGIYQVSNFGRVKGFKRTCFNKDVATKDLVGSIRSQYKSGKTNLKVEFKKEIGRGPKQVPKLVCEAFIRKMKPQEVTSHKDGDAFNNQSSNLKIVSRGGGSRFKDKDGLRISTTINYEPLYNNFD